MKRVCLVLVLAVLLCPVMGASAGPMVQANPGDVYVTAPELASVSAEGVKANDYASNAAISADGRYVAFFSRADNLTAEAHDGVFVKDTVTGAIELVSLDAMGEPASFSRSVFLDISADGRYVVFETSDRLVAEDSNSITDIYRVDVTTGEIVLITATHHTGRAANDYSILPTISADGRYVAFMSQATDLVPLSDLNGTFDAFVRDVDTATTVCISSTDNGAGVLETGNDAAGYSVISDDGRHVAFWTVASNLYPDDTAVIDLFVADLDAGTLTPVVVDLAGNHGNLQYDPMEDIAAADISADGSVVAFLCSASGLVANDTNGVEDVFVHDLNTGVIERVSVDVNGAQLASASTDCAITPDGTQVGFVASGALTLDIYPDSGYPNVFVRDLNRDELYLVSQKDGVAAQGSEPDGMQDLALSGDRFSVHAAYTCEATNLIEGMDPLDLRLRVYTNDRVRVPYSCYVPRMSR